MSIASPPQIAEPEPRLLTCADLFVLPEELPSGPVKYELDNGRLITIMAPPGAHHGWTQSTIVSELRRQGELPGHGMAFGEVGVVLWRNPDRVVGPDAAFIANDRLPFRTSPEGYLETIPHLIVEVRSRNDSLVEMQQKTRDYLQASVQIVWLVDPLSKTVTAHRQNAAPQVLRADDVLTANGVIPGFQLRFADIFPE